MLARAVRVTCNDQAGECSALPMRGMWAGAESCRSRADRGRRIEHGADSSHLYFQSCASVEGEGGREKTLVHAAVVVPHVRVCECFAASRRRSSRKRSAAWSADWVSGR
eukprot:1198993-Prymnesium_polylepis.1